MGLITNYLNNTVVAFLLLPAPPLAISTGTFLKLGNIMDNNTPFTGSILHHFRHTFAVG